MHMALTERHTANMFYPALLKILFLKYIFENSYYERNFKFILQCRSYHKTRNGLLNMLVAAAEHYCILCIQDIL